MLAALACSASGSALGPSAGSWLPTPSPGARDAGAMTLITDVTEMASDTPQPNDAGEPTEFNAWATPCTLGCTYTWTWDDGSLPTSSQHTNETYYSAGTYDVTCWTNATLGGGTSQTLSVVIASPVSVQAGGAPQTADATQRVALQARSSGGTAPVGFAWDLASGTRVSTADTNTSYLSAGHYSNQVWANDSRGTTSHAWWNLTVNADPSVAPVASPATLSAGEKGNFSAAATGGTPPFSYAWAFGNGSFATGASLQHAFLGPGTHQVEVWANDSAGVSRSGSVTVTVLPALAAVPSEPVDPALVGEQLHFTGAAQGGAPPYSFAWTFGDGNTARTQNATHDYGAVGDYPVSFWVNDTQGHVSHGSLEVNVTPSLTVTASVNMPTTDVNLPIVFQATLTGGVGPFTEAWRFGDGAFGSGSPVSHAFDFSGTYTPQVWVNDSEGDSTLASVQVTVNPGADLRAGAAAPSTDVGISDELIASATGGTSPLSFAWSTSGGVKGNTASLLEPFPVPGDYAAKVWVNDSAGTSRNTTVWVSVAPDPVASLTSNRTSATTAQQIEFFANFTGGTGPYTFLWAWGDGGESSSRIANHTYATPGTYTAHFWVNDSVGGSAWGLLSVTVQKAPATGSTPPPNSTPSTSAFTWVPLLVIVAVVAAAAVLLAYLRTRRGTLLPAEGAASGEGEAATGATGAVGASGAEFLPREEADYTGVGGDLPPWPTPPLTIYEGVDRSLLYQTAQRNGVDPSKLFILTLSETAELREKYHLEGAIIWQITRLEGENRISPGEIDRIAHLAEVHLNEGSGRAVLIDATESFLSATGVATTARFFHVLHEVAEQKQGTVLVFLNPRSVTIQERRALEEGAQRVRFGPRTLRGQAPSEPSTP